MASLNIPSRSPRVLALALVSTLGVSVAALGAPVTVPNTRFALKNGLTVILVEEHSVPRVHMGLRVRTGSAYETPGKTGFAHLFEHLMFEGSAHVPEGKFDQWLEAAGGENNAWTSQDATYYYEEAPSNALDLILFLESDRQAFFVDGLRDGVVDGQRDVVKNERRQRYDNRPYGTADLALPSLLYPKGHPYSWPVIGSMKDLDDAGLDDVKAFFNSHYAPENMILVLVGDFNTKDARRRIERYFGDVPSRGGRPAPSLAPVVLHGERRAVFEDDVELPRLTLVWPSPAINQPGDSALDLLSSALTGGASARLVKRLVHEERLAQSVSASQQSRERGGEFSIEVLAFPGQKLSRIVQIVDEELARIARTGPTEEELARARTVIESSQVRSLDTLSGIASRVATWAMLTGDADGLQADLDRYRKTTAADVTAAAQTLGRGRVVMSVVPRGQLQLGVINRVLPAFGGAR